VAGWRQPIGQDGKRLSARLTDSASYPDPFVLVVVRAAEPSSVANDRVILANRTSPRQEAQRDHPESPLSSACGSAIKRITAGVKAAADRPCQSFDLRPAFTLPVKSVSNERRIMLSKARREPLSLNIGRFLGVNQCSRLKGMPGTFHPHIMGGQAPEFGVEHADNFVTGLAFALAPLTQPARDGVRIGVCCVLVRHGLVVMIQRRGNWRDRRGK
jgi:hypothetical protein